MKVFKIIGMLAALIISANSITMVAPPQKPAAHSEETITLILEQAPQVSQGQKLPTYSSILGKRREYVVPRHIAEEAKTINHFMEDLQLKDNIPLGNEVNAAAMEIIKQIMWKIHDGFIIKHDQSEEKALLDALEVSIKIDPTVAFNLLHTANYLEFQPAIDLAARTIAKNPNLIAQLNKGGILGFFKKNNIVTNEMLKEIARYYFLVTGNNLGGIDEKSYGFSIQDYLDYKPDLIASRRDIYARQNRLNLSHLRLQSLKGLENIPNIGEVRILNLFHNQLQNLEAREFRLLPNVIILDLSHNQLTQLQPEALEGINVLHTLDLSYNKLTHFNERILDTLRRLLDHKQLDPLRLEFLEMELEPYAIRSYGPWRDPAFIYGPYLLLGHNPLTQEEKQKIKKIVSSKVYF